MWPLLLGDLLDLGLQLAVERLDGPAALAADQGRHRHLGKGR